MSGAAQRRDAAEHLLGVTADETSIEVELTIDGGQKARIETGIGFLDHMLDQVARHGLLDLTIAAKGDLHIDAHHTVEDVGICLGQALAEALADKAGIVRFGWRPRAKAASVCPFETDWMPARTFSAMKAPV